MRERLLTLLCCLLSLQAGAADAPPLRVAVAANFLAAARLIGERYTAHTGRAVINSSGATGTLATQIMHGAPFDVLLAADAVRPAELVARGHGEAATQTCYARGRLVLLGTNPAFDQLADPRLTLAIANPATAPYGVAAEAVLARAPFSAGRGRRIVRGASVLQAYQFYLSGATDLALVALSLAPDGGLPVPAQWHAPIEQVAVAMRHGDSDGGVDYIAHLRSEPVIEIIKTFGYDPC